MRATLVLVLASLVTSAWATFGLVLASLQATPALAGDECRNKTTPDPEAFTVKYRLENRKNNDTTKVVVRVVPSGLIENVESIKKIILEKRTNEAEGWIELYRNETTENYDWEFDTVPCKKNMVRLKMLDENICFQEIKSVGPSMEGFRPEPPKNIELMGSILSWTPSECADKYDVNIELNKNQIFRNETKETKIELKDHLKPCVEYNYDIFGVTKNKWSKEDIKGKIKTPPKPNKEELDAQKIEITSNETSIDVKWNISHSLSCLEKIDIVIGDLKNVIKSENIYKNKTFFRNLSHSTQYTIIINATHNNKEITIYRGSYTTKPRIEYINASVDDFIHNKITLTWPKCSTVEKYFLYKKKIGPNNKTEKLEYETEKAVFYQDGCTTFQYGVKAVDTNNFSSQVEWIDDPVMTGPRKEDYAAIQPAIDATENSVNITWKTPESLKCVDSFIVHVGNGLKLDDFDVEDKSYEIFGRKNLQHSTNYTASITARYQGEEEEVRKLWFLTKPKIDGVKVNKTDGHTIILNWPKAETAKEYRIYKKSTNELIKITNDTEAEIIQKICSKVEYGVKLVDVANMESEVTWTEEVDTNHSNCSQPTQVPQSSEAKTWDLTIVILTLVAILTLIVLIFFLKTMNTKKRYQVAHIGDREEEFRHRTEERRKSKSSFLNGRSKEPHVQAKAQWKVGSDTLDESLDEDEDDYLEVANNSLDEIVESLNEADTSYDTAITYGKKKYWSDGNMYI